MKCVCVCVGVQIFNYSNGCNELVTENEKAKGYLFIMFMSNNYYFVVIEFRSQDRVLC